MHWNALDEDVPVGALLVGLGDLRADSSLPGGYEEARRTVSVLPAWPSSREWYPQGTSRKKHLMTGTPFSYRILIVDDEPNMLKVGKMLLESEGYEVHTGADGFEGLAALKQSMPDIIISDLRMPNMSGFEFLSVVRRRFPNIPVVVISGEYSSGPVPANVLADAFFSKGGYRAQELFQKILDLIHELPMRPREANPLRPAVWVQKAKGSVVVTCTQCLRTFPVGHVAAGPNEAECDFCGCKVRFELIDANIA
ncbi:MAG TPA: response regulator [Terracidiphilus sp.]